MKHTKRFAKPPKRRKQKTDIFAMPPLQHYGVRLEVKHTLAVGKRER